MDKVSRYWQICTLSLADNKGYVYREIAPAKEYYIKLASDHSVSNLLTSFNSNSPLAGLCLRCYVSVPIVKACKKLALLFSSNHNFNYRDLLSFVLNDDGKNLVIVAEDRKNQLIIDADGKLIPIRYKLFSVDILASYKLSDSSLSLDNWAFLQTKQNSEIKNFLSEFGFQSLSDWAILNRIGLNQLSQLAVRDRDLVEIFHQVYRRDRRVQKNKRLGKCPDPNKDQLAEMQTLLKQHQIMFSNSEAILVALKRIATSLREYDVWNYREPWEIYNPDTGDYISRRDLLLDNANDLVEKEERAFLNFIGESLNPILVDAIEKASFAYIAKLKKSKKYHKFADKFIRGIYLYYEQRLSLKEIAPILELGNWDRARRVLNPGDFINRVRTYTVQELLKIVLEKAPSLGVEDLKSSPDRLQNLTIEIETFADEAIFQDAIAELKAVKNRTLNSLYAQQIRLYCQGLDCKLGFPQHPSQSKSTK